MGLVTSITVFPARFTGPAARIASDAAVPLTASTTKSPNRDASMKLPVLARGFFCTQSASLACVRVPNITSWPDFRKPPASAFATSPDPRMPIFMVASFLACSLDHPERWICPRI